MEKMPKYTNSERLMTPKTDYLLTDEEVEDLSTWISRFVSLKKKPGYCATLSSLWLTAWDQKKTVLGYSCWNWTVGSWEQSLGLQFSMNAMHLVSFDRIFFQRTNFSNSRRTVCVSPPWKMQLIYVPKLNKEYQCGLGKMQHGENFFIQYTSFGIFLGHSF